MAEGEKKKSRKAGRKRNACLAYRTNQRREFNKARRLKRHLRRHPLLNEDGWVALEKLAKVLFLKQKQELGLTSFMNGRPS
jgi:hypothetical protein